MNKKKTLIYIAIFMFTIWIIAIVHGLHSMSNRQIPDCEVTRRKLSCFSIEGDIVSSKYLYSDHGHVDILLVILKPRYINIYKNELSKSDSFWGVYDKKKNLVYFVMSYRDSKIEKSVWKKVIIDSYQQYNIELTNKLKEDFLQLPDTLIQYENENTIRL